MFSDRVGGYLALDNASQNPPKSRSMRRRCWGPYLNPPLHPPRETPPSTLPARRRARGDDP